MTATSLKNIFLRPAQTPVDEPLSVLIAAPPELCQPFLSLGAPDSVGGQRRVQLVTTTRDAAELPDDLRRFKPHLVIVSPEVRGFAPTLVQSLARWPDFPLAVVGLVPPNGTWGAELTAAGAVAFYTTPVTPSLVERFVAEAPELAARARERWRQPLRDAGLAEPLGGAVPYRTGVIAFWSTKGGDGKTTLAVNCACLLALVAGQRVLLVDADMNGGRIALHLDIAPGQNTLFHLASDYRAGGNRLEARQLRARVVPVDRALDPRTKAVESRLEALLGLTQIQQASSDDLFGRQGQQFIHDLLRLARELYDFVIVDLGSSTQHGPHFGALQAADRVVFVNTSDRSSLFFNRETLRALVRGADLRADKFKLVINRYAPEDRLDLKDVAEFMGLPVFATVPENRNRAMTAAINQGRPFVLDHLGKNDGDAEATVRGLLAVAEGLYPSLGRLLAARPGPARQRSRLPWRKERTP
jgi:MinD-like ATPase involved in chromosome partitioning or flagellar assembly